MSDERHADMCTTHHHACDCREFAMAQEIEHLRAAVCDLKRLICIDGAELRNLCAARDEARRERDALRTRIDDAAVGEVVLDAEGYTAIYPPLDWRFGKRVALVPLDD